MVAEKVRKTVRLAVPVACGHLLLVNGVLMVGGVHAALVATLAALTATLLTIKSPFRCTLRIKKNKK